MRLSDQAMRSKNAPGGSAARPQAECFDEFGEGGAMPIDKRKRHRRTATEIQRHFKCQVEGCYKSYGSEGSLNQHMKLKHYDYYQQQIRCGNLQSGPGRISRGGQQNRRALGGLQLNPGHMADPAASSVIQGKAGEKAQEEGRSQPEQSDASMLKDDEDDSNELMGRDVEFDESEEGEEEENDGFYLN